MVELVYGLNIRKHLRYHFLWEHVMGTVFLVNSKVKDLLKKKEKKNKSVRNDNGNLNKLVNVLVDMCISNLSNSQLNSINIICQMRQFKSVQTVEADLSYAQVQDSKYVDMTVNTMLCC